jgi:hypothetical protein
MRAFDEWNIIELAIGFGTIPNSVQSHRIPVPVIRLTRNDNYFRSAHPQPTYPTTRTFAFASIILVPAEFFWFVGIAAIMLAACDGPSNCPLRSIDQAASYEMTGLPASCSWRSIILSGNSVNDRVRQNLRKLRLAFTLRRHGLDRKKSSSRARIYTATPRWKTPTAWEQLECPATF